jgi:hypothetical protein
MNEYVTSSTARQRATVEWVAPNQNATAVALSRLTASTKAPARSQPHPPRPLTL